MRRALLSALLLCPLTFAGLAHADIGTEEFLRHQERQRQLQQQMAPDNDVRLPRAAPDTDAENRLPEGEAPCFAVDGVKLTGDLGGHFRGRLDSALGEAGFRPGLCLGMRGINLIMRLAQDRIIADGYVTTRIVAQAQNIGQSRALELAVIPGRIRQIRYAPKNGDGGQAGRFPLRNALPMAEGGLLNLRDIETALENLRRVQTAEADFEIVPAEQPGESDIVIRWKQSFPLRLTLSLDDSGSSWTGKNQGTLTLSADSPLGLSDTFYASFSRDLGHKKNLKDRTTGERWKSGTEGYGFSYSVPFGYWALSMGLSHNEYRQAVAGFYTNYLYWGESETQDIALRRVLYRDGARKGAAGLGLWRRESRNYIDDAELAVQHRRTAGWQMEAEHTEYVGQATLRAQARYRQGTGALSALRAPEEYAGEGSSRMRLSVWDFSASVPFRLAGQALSLSSQAHAQLSHSRLTPQDRLSIGSRHTVRGFDGEATLMGERGYTWRNELAWNALQAHQMYLFWDAGQVRGPSVKTQVGSYLEGAGVGLRGQVQAGGLFYYDLFAARPVKHPDHFPARQSVLGAAVSVSL